MFARTYYQQFKFKFARYNTKYLQRRQALIINI
jgi:hypothetical protein